MGDATRFAVYFSHSWRPRDVDLNLQLWDQLAGRCELLVDIPDEPGANPPYYINRIEELFRRTDFFVSVLTYREATEGATEPGDARLRCSPYSLFEVRLAERADMPRLILYERSTGFRPPQRNRPGELYIPFDRATRDRLPEPRQWETVVRPKVQDWTEWAARISAPSSYEQSMCALVLAGAGRPDRLDDVIGDCLSSRGYDPTRFDPDRQASREAFRLLREAGLVVADFGTDGPLGQQLYAAAHALGVPTIRLRSAAASRDPLPWVLRGDPGGYQHDIVEWSTPDDLPALIDPRIAAMFRVSSALRDGGGSSYLQSKRYSPYFVFISHTLKPPHRALVDEVYAQLDKKHVRPFEYHQVNTAGMDWRTALVEALEKTTHFIVLLSPEYEQSETCTLELETILARGSDVTILPFMVAGRARPHPKLGELHHRLLSEADGRAAAEIIVDQTMAALDHALVSSQASQ